MDNQELLTIYTAIQSILGKGKRKNKINGSDIAQLMPCLVDIIDNEPSLATRLQAIIEEYQQHLAIRILDNRQTTLEDQLFNTLEDL